MLIPIFRSVLFCLGVFFLLNLSSASPLTEKNAPVLRAPVKQLFSHKNHAKVLLKGNIACTDCHSFSVKGSGGFDPLGQNIEAGHLQISPKVCHECHMGQVEFPRVNQCSLCHLQPERLKPESHFLNWKVRHGSFAKVDPNACATCHQENQNSCANCHTQRNSLKHSVHRPNFRMTHSMEARMNPASCTVCHSTPETCVQCHRGGTAR